MARVGADIRRQDFVQATVRVIAEHGAAKTTTRRIAEAVGCPLGTLHYVYHTKEELFWAVWESLWDQPEDRQVSSITGDTVVERIENLLKASLKWLSENPDLARAQAELTTWALRSNPDLAKASYASALEHAQKLITELAKGELSDTTIDIASRIYILSIDGILVSWFIHKDLERLEMEADIAAKSLGLLVANS